MEIKSRNMPMWAIWLQSLQQSLQTFPPTLQTEKPSEKLPCGLKALMNAACTPVGDAHSLAMEVAIYRMGPGKWDRKWEMAPGLKWPKHGH